MNGTDKLTLTPAKEGKFFRRLDWSAFWTAFVSSLAVYCYTLAPTVTLEDSGELAVGGDWAGVPHPPGYPVWTMVVWVFARIFSFVPFRGQPNPAWAIALASAFFGALATGISAMLVCRSGSDLLRGSDTDTAAYKTSPATENTICWIGGVVGSLLFAFTPVMWSQTVIVEIYAMNAFFLMFMFLLSYRWMCQPSDKTLFLIAFIFGLSLAHYYVLLLALLPLVVIVMLRDIDLFRDFCIAGIPYLAAMGLIATGVLPPISHPTDIVCFVYLSLNFVVLALVYFLLPRGRTVAPTILLAQVGFAFYAYMPLASDIRNPPINWGYPRTWQGFLHAVTRGQYEKIVPTDVFSMLFVHQIADYFIDLRRQFTLIPELIGFVAFAAWMLRLGRYRVHALHFTVPLAVLATVVSFSDKYLGDPDTPVMIGPIEAHKVFMGLLLLLVALSTVPVVVEQTLELADRLKRDADSSLSERIVIFLVFLVACAIYGFYVVKLAGKIGEVTAPFRLPDAKFQPGEISAILRQVFAIVVLMAMPVILFGLFVMVRKTQPDFKLTLSSYSQKWFIALLLGFAALSLGLIAAANPKGDIQDAFIQKVKFISSHALYAVWIGYGLIMGLAFVDRLFKGNPAIKWLSLGGAALISFIPIEQNLFNKELIRIYGGAEQNGHDFGWQFGNYQLRGAHAINEELDAQEEPLPNPEYPPEMSTNAIFYGGTDPGRFVPTYMIYSAQVREDVYLITQNALADNTYMSVMRDLYGDRIWIPSPAESAGAFQRYVTEVRSGKRPKNAELTISEGRVQVSGALGVMEINGILAEMIFEQNNWRHDFYVEESYIIQWMFPHLTPHGLIMKINRNPAPLDPENIRNDLDFWDWYQRRLSSNIKFIRDIVARKSFSKLRSAIAGLYSSRGSLREAEAAFQEARMLYPLSPEANFRLLQEVYIRMNRSAEAREVIMEFQRQDPSNDKVKAFVDQLNHFEDLGKKIETIEKELGGQGGKLDINMALQLAELYQDSGRAGNFMQLANQILSNTNLPSIIHFRLAQLYARARRTAEMLSALDLCMRTIPPNVKPEVFLEVARMYAQGQDLASLQKMYGVMEKYLALKPDDWKAWLDLASLAMAVNRNDDSLKALREAIRYGGTEARGLIEKNPRLAPLLSKIGAQPFNLFGGPNVTGVPPLRTPPPLRVPRPKTPPTN